MGTHGVSHTLVLLLMIAFYSSYHQLYNLTHIYMFVFLISLLLTNRTFHLQGILRALQNMILESPKDFNTAKRKA